jgi:transcriptional regulator with XRE-family HTH domain
MKLAKALSYRIKSLREAAGLSQQEVAARGDLSLSLVAKLEQGKKADPRASTILALADALSARPGALLDDLFPPAAAEEMPAPARQAVADGTPGEGEAKEAKKKKKDGKKKKKS